MTHWFFPSASGDFALTEKTPGVVTLDVENPTADEVTVLLALLAHAKTAGWLQEDLPTAIPRTGVYAYQLSAPLADVGPVLSTLHFGAESTTWTAIRSRAGTVTLSDGTTPPSATEVAAVTLRAPNRGCPEPTSAERRASRVLRAFSTLRQWAEWQLHGRMVIRGSKTGGRFVLYHRDQAAKLGLKRVLIHPCGAPVCAWDWSVPPEEEALAIKLAVEHREPWIMLGGLVVG